MQTLDITVVRRGTLHGPMDDRIRMHADLNAEEAVLSYMTNNGKHAARIFHELTEDMFYYPGNVNVYNAIKRILARKEPLDYHAVERELGGDTMDENVRQTVLMACSNAVSEEAVPYHIENLRRCRYLRLYMEWMWSGMGIVGGPMPTVSDVAAHAQQMPQLTGGSTVTPISEITLTHRESGTSTGFGRLDQLVGRVGYIDGQIWVWSAYHKGGKTALMTQSAVSCATGGARVCFATLSDLNPGQLKRRMFHQMAGHPMPVQLDDQDADILQRLNDLDIHIYNGAKHGTTIEEIEANLMSAHYRHDYDVIFLDYFQRIRSRNGEGDSRVGQLEHYSNRLSTMAQSMCIPVVVGSQITKGENGTVITKGGRALEEDAGIVARIKRDKEGTALRIAYNRFGPSNVDVPATWDPNSLTFAAA